MSAQLNFGTGNSVTFGTTGSSVSTTISCTVSSLSNVQVGDLLVAWIHSQNTGTGTITSPTGWTRYGAAIGSPSTSTSRQTNFFYYPINSQSDITNLGTTLTWSFSAGSGRIACVVSRATGIDLTHIEDSAATSFTGGGTNSLSISAITTVNPTTLVVGGFFHENSISTSSPNTTSFMTAFQEYRTNPDGTVANTGAAIGYQYLTAAGSTGSVIASLDNSATVLGGELVAFRALTASQTATTPTIVGTATTFTTTSTVSSFTITTPTGLQNGDALLLALSAQTSTATADFTSAGWTRISQPFIASSGGYRVIAFYALPVPTAANVTQTSFTFTSTDSGSGGRIAAEMFVVRGAELSSLTTAYSAYAGPSGPTVTIPYMNPTVSNGLMLAAFNTNVVSGVDYTIQSGPSGMTQQNFLVTSTGAQSKTTLAVYQMNLPTTATVSNESLTWNAAASQYSGVGVVIRPLGSFDANNGVAIQYTNDVSSLASARLYFTSATDTLSTPKEVRPVPTGYASVSAMLSSTPFHVAHRGGSLDWPEMSLYAYTQSVFWGMGALEVSLARTLDGVWFGLHDASLDRTSLNSGGGSGTTLVASSMTWAQVQAYQIQYPTISNPASQPQPYMRWEELMNAYYGTHIIFVDPKVASAYTSELLAMMNAMPGSPTSRFVAKSYGVTGNVGNTTGWPHVAGSAGYQTWGYFYEADYSNVPAYQGRYTILGMDYTATANSWTQITSYSKPVIGHIVPNTSAVATAIGYGAAGVMVSGVQEAITRSS